MNCGLTVNQMWSLIGAAGFLGMVVGVVITCILQSGHSKDAFWEEE